MGMMLVAVVDLVGLWEILSVDELCMLKMRQF